MSMKNPALDSVTDPLQGFKDSWAENHPEYDRYKLERLWINAWRDCSRLDVGRELKVKNYRGGPMGVKGEVISAKPSRLKFLGRSVRVVFEVTLACGYLVDVPKVEKVVYLQRIPIC